MAERFALGHALIDRRAFEEVLADISQMANQQAPSMVVTPNADHVVMLERNAGLREAYSRATLVVPDGMPLVWASRLLRSPVRERVSGADLLPRLCERAAKQRLKVFLLGGGAGVAERAAQRLTESYPGLIISGTLSPPHGFELDTDVEASVVRTVANSDSDLVFVCLGAPKQELWISRNLASFEKGVFLGVGAAIDFCAGTVRRAPVWMQRSGFEWLFRLWQEPRRLTLRYLRDLYFFVIVAREAWYRRNAKRRASCSDCIRSGQDLRS